MTAMVEQLIAFISKEFLEGEDVGLTETTPLLELGVIDSISIVLLQRFIQSNFGVEVPPAELTPKNLGTIRAICELVERLRASGPGG